MEKYHKQGCIEGIRGKKRQTETEADREEGIVVKGKHRVHLRGLQKGTPFQDRPLQLSQELLH